MGKGGSFYPPFPVMAKLSAVTAIAVKLRIKEAANITVIQFPCDGIQVIFVYRRHT